MLDKIRDGEVALSGEAWARPLVGALGRDMSGFAGTKSCDFWTNGADDSGLAVTAEGVIFGGTCNGPPLSIACCARVP